jgi:hypothetical protein
MYDSYLADNLVDDEHLHNEVERPFKAEDGLGVHLHVDVHDDPFDGSKNNRNSSVTKIHSFQAIK